MSHSFTVNCSWVLDWLLPFPGPGIKALESARSTDRFNAWAIICELVISVRG